MKYNIGDFLRFSDKLKSLIAKQIRTMSSLDSVYLGAYYVWFDKKDIDNEYEVLSVCKSEVRLRTINQIDTYSYIHEVQVTPNMMNLLFTNVSLKYKIEQLLNEV